MIGREWWRSSYSKGGDANCVECRSPGRQVHVRDSRNPGLGYLAFPCAEWQAFLRGLGERTE